MNVVLISTYDLGRQPFGLASPAAFLRGAGHEVRPVDVTREKLREDDIRQAGVVAFYLPMHTATRLALPVMDRVRALNPSAHLCAYGLYAPLNADVLREHGVHTILGPEFERALVDLCSPGGFRVQPDDPLPRITFVTPDRSDLPPLTRYASLQIGDERRVAGYTEATRGCKHRCRHCPIVPVYDGRFRAVDAGVVLADVRAQVAAGAQHITFGDPDFFNGPTHALRIVEALARECPGVSYDVTIKVEHLKNHAAVLPRLRDTGCAFVTCAVESFDDEVLEKLEKGHTHADFAAVVEHCRAIGLTLSPTFVAFTPWTTLDGYAAMLQEIDRLHLVPAVAPIQYAIRLLIPQGSRMLELPEVRRVVTGFNPASLAHGWRHPDPRVDALQQEIERLVGSRLNAPRDEMFGRAWDLAHAAAASVPPAREPLVSRAAVPYLNEPWYC
ncbi:MAG TPA: CUAEP/CCAEP-tail radical SAM protein [Vicinamibacterales bacterium]|nr:CUAEP/CCAEP-tail radical SAM protein [Vicinamibacterales bacterium]